MTIVKLDSIRTLNLAISLSFELSGKEKND